MDVVLWLVVGMEILAITLLCILIIRKGGRVHGRLTKDTGQDKSIETAPPERQQRWISIMQASKEYGLDRSWIYRRVRKGIIPVKFEDGRILVSMDWFEQRAIGLAREYRPGAFR